MATSSSNLRNLVALIAGAAVVLGGVVACGPAGDHLLGDGSGGGGGGGGGNGDPNGGWGSGSTYNADGGPQAPVAQQLFQALQPELTQKCGGACHVDGTTLSAPRWLADPAYTTITTYPGIVGTDVYSSKLLNRPANHPASSLVDPGNEALLAQVTTWLTAEANAIAAVPLPSSDPVDPATGSVDLTKAATGISGAKITFTATQMGSLLKFSNVMLVAPGSTGIHILSPIFSMVPASGPEVDNTDFSTTELSVASGASSQITPVFYFAGWVPGSKLKLQFEKIESATVAGSDGGTSQTTACKDVTTFTNSAAPTLKNQCVSCHGGGNGTATASMDLTALNNNDYNTACTQAHSQVNTANKPQSNILLAPLKQVNHPVQVFANTSATGYQAILTWVNKE